MLLLIGDSIDIHNTNLTGLCEGQLWRAFWEWAGIDEVLSDFCFLAHRSRMAPLMPPVKLSYHIAIPLWAKALEFPPGPSLVRRLL